MTSLAEQTRIVAELERRLSVVDELEAAVKVIPKGFGWDRLVSLDGNDLEIHYPTLA